MSTRCQVEVKASGLSWTSTDKDILLLYHHCDGYPTYMLKLLAKAYRSAIAKRKAGTFVYQEAWKAGRPGHAAAFIIGSDVSGFEPEQGLELHGDIEWFYVIDCINVAGGSTAEHPIWNVSIFVPKKGFWDNSTRENMERIATGNILTLVRKAKSIEKAVRG